MSIKPPFSDLWASGRLSVSKVVAFSFKDNRVNPEFKYYEGLPYLNDFYMEVHYKGTAVQDESIQRVLAERGKTVYATAVRSGAILVDTGNLKLLGDVKVFGR